MDARYRIQNDQAQIWDTTDNRWRCLTDGRYNSYKTEAKALAVARKIKSPAFWASTGTHICEDKS